MKYLKLKTAIKRVRRGIKVSTFNDMDIAEMISNVLEEILVSPAMNKNLAFLTVKNGITRLPDDFDTLLRAYAFYSTINNEITCKDACEIAEDAGIVSNNTPDNDDDDNKCVKKVCGVVVYNIKYGKNLVGGIHNNRDVIPLKPGDYHFTSNRVCGYKDLKEKLKSVIYYYDIRQDKLKVNFDKGVVVLFYLGKPVDEDGFIMVPDNHYVFSAIEYYILMKNAEYMMSIGRRYAINTLQYFSKMYHQYRDSAKAALRNENPLDKRAVLKELNILMPFDNYYSL